MTVSAGVAAFGHRAEDPARPRGGGGRRAVRGQARRQEPRAVRARACRPARGVGSAGTWESSTTRFASISSSSAAPAPTQPRSNACSAPHSATRRSARPAAEDQPVAAEPAPVQAAAPVLGAARRGGARARARAGAGTGSPRRAGASRTATRQFTLQELEDAEQHAESHQSPSQPSPPRRRRRGRSTSSRRRRTSSRRRRSTTGSGSTEPPKDFDF